MSEGKKKTHIPNWTNRFLSLLESKGGKSVVTMNRAKTKTVKRTLVEAGKESPL